jgi:hypothetical protein
MDHKDTVKEPVIDAPLIEYLRDIYRLAFSNFAAETPTSTIYYRAGQRHVVEKLEDLFKRQQENILNVSENP